MKNKPYAFSRWKLYPLQYPLQPICQVRYKADINKFSLNLIFDHVTRKSIKGYLLSSVNHYTGLVTIKQASFTCMILFGQGLTMIFDHAS